MSGLPDHTRCADAKSNELWCFDRVDLRAGFQASNVQRIPTQEARQTQCFLRAPTCFTGLWLSRSILVSARIPLPKSESQLLREAGNECDLCNILWNRFCSIWLEAVEGLSNARQRMEEIATQKPGHYFMALQQNLWVKGPWKKALRGKVQSRDFPTALGNPATACISTFSTTPATTVNFPISPQKENS